MPFRKAKKDEEAPKPVVEVPKDQADWLRKVELLSGQIDKEYKTTRSIARLGSKVGQNIPVIPSHCPTFDNEVLGVGGIPRGRIIEIYGPESSGKTTICLEFIASCQDAGGKAAFVDAEHALEPTYAHTLGVDVDNLLVSQPDYGEQSLAIAESLVDTKLADLIVIDSVAALVPKAELDGDMGDSNVGLHARLMSQAMRKLVGKTEKAGVTLIFTNQIREKIGVMFGSPETTTGGRALKFYASVRLDVRRREAIRVGGETGRLVGHELEIKAVKNKVATPYNSTKLRLYYPDSEFPAGLDRVHSAVSYAVARGIIEQKGSWYAFKDENIAQGEDRVIELLRTDAKLYASIIQRISELTTADKAAMKVRV
jgi:recombination protein RecA